MNKRGRIVLMKIAQVIDHLIQYECGEIEVKKFGSQKEAGKLIKLGHDTDRDKILYGQSHLDDQCTGIVTTCWPSVEVIRKTHQYGANLIICHEAMFWNHGDHTTWLKENHNETFAEKKRLLDQYKIVVRRDHDHLHSGIPASESPDGWADGIFYGYAQELGWTKYMQNFSGIPLYFDFPAGTTARNIAQDLIAKLHLNGCRIEGDLDTPVRKAIIPLHNLGDANEIINLINQEKIDCVLTMEMIDFTLAEYIRDSNMLGLNKAIVQIGHFNTEEAGMHYMQKWLPEAIKNTEIPINFVQSGDMYHFIAES